MNPVFDVHDLVIWLRTAQTRWEAGGHVTARLEGNGINIYQDGKYRAAIMLDDERPILSHWADEEA